MRMSVSHPDSKHYQVFCDGVLLKDCIAADEEDGTATIFARDAAGKFIIEKDCGSHGDIATRVVRGKIEFRRIVSA